MLGSRQHTIVCILSVALLLSGGRLGLGLGLRLGLTLVLSVLPIVRVVSIATLWWGVRACSVRPCECLSLLDDDIP